MPKHQSPIRLEKSLMNEAKAAAKINHRTEAETIEYWANLGRQASSYLDPVALASVSTGTAKIVVKSLQGSMPVDADDVFSELEAQRLSGELEKQFAGKHPLRYQASKTCPGLLDRIDPEGQVTTGTFSNGEFVEQTAT